MPADDLEPLSARAYAGTVMILFYYCIQARPAYKGLRHYFVIVALVINTRTQFFTDQNKL